MRRGTNQSNQNLSLEVMSSPPLGVSGPSQELAREEGVDSGAAASLIPHSEPRSSSEGSSTSGPVKSRPGLYVGLLTAFSGIAGFLFGYDTGNISGALPYIRDELLLGYKLQANRLHWIEGVIVSAAVFGAAVGSACGGALSDRLGRKMALKTADVFFAVGAVVMAAAPNAAVLVLGRLLVGLGVGLASVTAPVYIAETAPSNVRATLVTVNTLMITMGQFVAYLLDYMFTFAPGTWRWMLGVAAVPAMLQIIGLSFLPESPRWLLAHGENEQARGALAKLRRPGELEEEFREATSAAAALKSQRGASALKAPEVQQELFLGIGLQILQQACGINTVMYYTPSILGLAGITNNRTALLIALGPAAVNAAGTILGMIHIDRTGRRKLLLSSIMGVVLALVLLGGAFKLSETHTPAVSASTCPAPGIATCNDCIVNGCSFCNSEDQAQAPGVCIPSAERCPATPRSTLADSGCPSPFLPMIVAGVVLYLAAFSPGLGTVPWSVNAEIFPVEVRGLANGAAATANWLTNAVVSQLFLALADYVGGSGVFWLLACIAFAGVFWVHVYLPETKGLTLEQVQDLFIQRCQRSASRRATLPQTTEA